MITIFTPTYNRANLLSRLFDSLEAQTCKDFEWIVVDDGSKDNTSEVINNFASIASFPVKYFFQENGGKHRAVNRGVKEASGELFFIADADDWLPNNSIEIVLLEYSKIQGKKEFAGVCGLDMYENGSSVCENFNEEIMECSSIDLRYKYNVKGDMKEVYLTSIMKQYPFPEINGERFSPEDLVWNRIAKNFKLRFFKKYIYTVEYQENGLTANITLLRMKSPIASTIHYQELVESDVSILIKIKAVINYWRFWMCINKKRDAPGIGLLWSWVLPLGWAMHLNDLRKVR